MSETERHDPDKAVDFILKHAKLYAQAKADRVHLELFRKSKKALLMLESKATALAAQERDAYAHPDYITLLDGIKAATELEEHLKWKLTAAQARIEIWRSMEASNRASDRATR